MTAKLRSDDRVLLLGITSRGELAAVARVLMKGVLVALGTRDEVDEAREAMTEFDNVMFIEARPNSIPWRDGFFTKILVPHHLEPLLSQFDGELERLLSPNGEIVRLTLDA